LLLVVGLLGVLGAIAVPQVLVGIDRQRAVAAARYLAHQCGAARIQAIGRSANVALRLRERGGEYVMQVFADRNGNGVRTADIDAGIDLPLSQPESLGIHFPGVRIGLAPGLGSDPVKLGAGGLLSFSPLGTATAGSIFILGKDGSQFAVRVVGATARTRLEEYDRHANRWVSTW
jgi:type II secretory pathway pseudopilin PulG